MRHTLLALAAVTLAACQPQDPDGKRAEPPADAMEEAAEAADAAAEAADEAAKAAEEAAEALVPKEFGGDIDARGTEPFWNLEIRPGAITLTRPEPSKPVTVANPGVQETGGEAVWSTSVDGKAFIVTLVNEGTCSDGMSDLDYPYMAVVTLGELTYRGCAYKTSAKPKGAE